MGKFSYWKHGDLVQTDFENEEEMSVEQVVAFSLAKIAEKLTDIERHLDNISENSAN